MIIKGKYSGWGTFLKAKREARFRSAREFCSQVALGISYPQYSRYEAGDQLPSLEQALSLGAILGVPPLEVVLEWAHVQVPASDPVTQGGVARLLSEQRGPQPATPAWQSSTPETSVPLDDVIVFNRSHLKVFASDPAYRDIFTYINSFGPDWIELAEISAALGLAADRMQAMATQLHELGVIVLEQGRCRASKRNFYFPDDADFFELRNLNLRHNAQDILGKLSHDELVNRRAYRGLVTRELTAEQLKMLLAGVDRLMSQLVAMPETSDPRIIYSLCVLLGERFARAAQHGTTQGLTRDASGSLVGAESVQSKTLI